jgi:small-conductance mechanosensitive channel
VERGVLSGTEMEQLRIGFPPPVAINPFSRLVFGLLTLLAGVAAAAVVLFVVLPLAGIIVSAAVGGMILALAGLVMMVPFMLVAGTILAFMARNNARRPGLFRARSYWR